MAIFNRLRSKINIKLLAIVFTGILILALTLTGISVSMINTIFESRYEDKLQTPARILLAQYTYKDIHPYVEKLSERENFIKDSEQYMKDRQFVNEIEQDDSLAKTQEFYLAQTRMSDFVESLAELKDDKYYDINKRMMELRVGTGLTHFFIFADLGLPDSYVHIFDSVFLGDVAVDYSVDFGTPNPKSFYQGAKEVFATGDSVLVYNNPDDPNSYFSFMPVTDNYGDVIAVIGTFINMQSLNSQLQTFLLRSIGIILIMSIILLVVVFLVLRKLIIKPIQQLTTISGEIVAGNMHQEIPGWVDKRTDEMGTLGKSYKSMNSILHKMLTSNNALFEAAMSGKLEIRSDTEQFKGLFSDVANRINDTLDIIVKYFDSIPGSLAILDSNYDIVFMNSNFRQMFTGFTNHEIFGKILESEDESKDESIESLKEKLSESLSQGEYSSLIWVDFKEERRCLAFICSGVTLEGNNNGAVIVAMDSTELVLAKDRALSANKAKTEFLSRVSHELRTPLNVILSMSKLGLDDKKLDQSKERFRKIVSSSSHLSSIINDVLEMSRMESGKTEINAVSMNLRNVIDDCTELLEIKAAEKQVTLLHSVDENIPSILIGDDFRIRQILINLLSNAIKFTLEGRVSVDAKITDDPEKAEGQSTDIVDVTFTVSDTGIGMSDEFLGKIFTPFEQEDSFLSRHYEGTGLGLSISHNLVKLMGGDITVKSKLGEGTNFIFNIPFTKADQNEIDIAETASAGEDFSSLKGKHMLLADDIDINRLIVMELFADTGIIIDEAVDGEDAYQKYLGSRDGYYNCILMDVQMPKMNGYEATKAIRNSVDRVDHKIPIVAMTANALKEDIDHAVESGMDDHIAKPLDFDICMQIVKKYCEAVN